MLNKRNRIAALFGIIILFLALRIPAIHRPYHQDEYKWPIIVNPALTPEGGIPHPPVGEFIYREFGRLVGYDNFRSIPLFFSFLNLILVYLLAKKLVDEKYGTITAFIFCVSAYSVMASLMVDTDGAILPFFLLTSLYSYYSIRQTNFILKGNYVWLGILAGSIVFGFLTKASFAIGIAAIALDFGFQKQFFSDKRKLLKFCLYSIGGVVLLAIVLIASSYIFPFFRLGWSIQYWEHFIKFSNRGWFQTLIQFIKALFYLSPALVSIPLYTSKKDVKELRPFVLFTIIGLVFYLIAFDFSQGALDRYFQFLVLPLSFLVSAVIYKNWQELTENLKNYKKTLPAVLFSAALCGLLFLHHSVPPLYPKTEWINRIISLKLNFLFPFSGGSGPLTFYVSFLFISLAWILSIVFISASILNRKNITSALFAVLLISLCYNLVFIEEYLFGKIYGSAPKLVLESAEFIKSDPEIKKVVVYNDNGGYEIQKIEKYEKRLYTSPQFDITQKIQTINNFSGHYLEIDAPPIDPKSIYRMYLDSCEIIYQRTNKYINARIYDCRQAKDL